MELSDRTIAVTGATGFLGGYLVRALRDARADVIAVVRNPDKARRLLPADVTLRSADLSDRAALARAFSGCDAVISNAAVISFANPRETMRTNVDGTRNVFVALREAGVGRAIAISSSAAYPLSRRTLHEHEPLLEHGALGWLLNAYGVSKAEAERIAWQQAKAGGVSLTTFRPCGITGPHDPLLISYVERFLKPRVSLYPTHVQIGVVHAEDVAQAVLLALAKPELAGGKAYNLQGNTATLWQLADAWRRAGGRTSALRLPLPVPIALRYDDSLVRRELGWQPRDIDAIMREAVQARRPQRAATEPRA